MQSRVTVDDILEMTRRLTPLEKLKVIERLAPEFVSSLAAHAPQSPADLDDQYQKGYERLPETTTDLELLLAHLPLPREQW